MLVFRRQWLANTPPGEYYVEILVSVLGVPLCSLAAVGGDGDRFGDEKRFTILVRTVAHEMRTVRFQQQ